MRSSPVEPWERDRARAYAAYRRRGRWGVDGPPLLGGTGLAGAGLVLARGSVGTTSAWADTALILMMFPTLVLAFFVLVVLAGLAYLIYRLLGWLPGKADPVKEVLARVADGTHRASQGVTRVVIAPAAAGAAAQR